MTTTLKEYKCSCGNLLFKGLLYLCTIEIECSQCHKISLFGELKHDKSYPPFVVTVDQNNNIINSYGLETILGHPEKELVGRPIGDICPLLNDSTIQNELKENLKKGVPYEIKNNAFLLRDGSQQSFQSLFFSTPRNGQLEGYGICSKS